MGNLELTRKKDYSLFRKIAIGTWRTAYDPSVYGTLELVMDRALAYIEAFRQATGRHLTVTHMMARAMGEVFKKHPEANAVLRFNRVYLRKRASIFMQVVMTDQGTDKIDLSGVTIHDIDQKSLVEIVDEVEQRVATVRKRQDPALEKSRGFFRFIPHMLLNGFLRLLSFLTVTLNLNLSRFGIPRDPFGSAMLTNIGTLGLDTAFAPIVPYSRVPIVMATGAVKEAPWVENGQIVIRKVMHINATFDHRFIDGFHAAAMARTLREWMEDPETNFGPISGAAMPPVAHD